MSFVAVAGGRIVGAVLGGHDGRRGYLHHLAVDAGLAPPRHRPRAGRGRPGRLKAAGLLKCNLFLYAHNEAGRAFWLKHGWAARDGSGARAKAAGVSSQAPGPYLFVEPAWRS